MLRFFTIQISEAKKNTKGAVQTTGIYFSQFRGWDVQDQGVAESVFGGCSLAGLQIAVFWFYPHMESREKSKLALISL